MTHAVYRLGVLGLGEGRSIMSAALNSSRWELRKVCDLNPKLCKEREKEFGFSQWTTEYQELLEDSEIDVIAIYTPDPLHGEHIKQALQADKHVICTKPLLVSLDAASELLELCERSGKHVFVGQSSRFFEPMMHQRQDYEKGRFGEIQTVEAHYYTDGRWFLERPWTRKNGFSWMYNFMSHAVDLVRWYLPGIQKVTGLGLTSSISSEYDVEAWDSMRFLCQDGAGRIGIISGNFTLPTLSRDAEPAIGCTIRGTRGTSRAEYFNLQYHTHFRGEGKKVQTFSEKHDYYFRFEGESHHAGEYQNYIDYFAECLDESKVPRPDIHEGIRTVAMMEAMQTSAKEDGRQVDIQEILDAYALTIEEDQDER